MRFLRDLFAMPSASRRDRALDGLRGVAVLLTFFVHFGGQYLVSFRSGNPDVTPLTGWAELQDKVLYWLYRSHHGVSIFFILSGFLICRLVLRPGPFGYGRFIKRRVLRIYPAFLFAFALCLTISLFLFGAPPPSSRTVLANLVFLNGLPGAGIPPIVFNGVTWSLFFEICFYVMFPAVALVLRRRLAPPLMVLVLAGLAAAYLPSLWGVSTENFVLFFAGALVGLLNREQIARIGGQVSDGLLLAAYFFLTTASTFGLIDGPRFLLLFSAIGALLLLKAASGAGLIARGLAWGPLAWLGGISYSFYLLHCVPLYLVVNYAAFRGMPPEWPHVLLLGTLSFSGAVALAALSFALTERFYFRAAKPAPGLVGHPDPTLALMSPSRP